MQEDRRFHEVTRRIDPQGKLLRAWPLAGGVSAQTVALEIERGGGQRQRLVMRLHGARDLQQNPHIAADEFRLLQIVRSHGIAAPAPVAYDLSGDPFPTPYIVLEYVEGETEFTPPNVQGYLAQVAAQLARIHTIDGAQPDLTFLPRREERAAARLARPSTPDEAFHEPQIYAALAGGRALPRRNRATLLHGDFWPGNLLWKEGRLAAVIDWEDAATGDPLADLANSRLEVLWAFGSEAMEIFTQQYRSQTSLDWNGLPAWDLYAALVKGSAISNWGLDAAAERAMREAHRGFVMQALAAHA